MAQLLRVPSMGLGATSGTLVAWLKREGDAVKPGDVLYEVETDKAAVEVAAEAAGVLGRILVGVGQPVEPGTAVAWLGDGAGDGVAVPAGGEPPTASQPMAGQPQAQGPRPRASPYARRLARERGIAWERLTGSGPGGRVVARDVLAVAGDSPRDRMRRAIAERTAAGARVPQFAAQRTVQVAGWHQRLEQWRRGGSSVGWTDVFVAAALFALRRVPRLHARYREGEGRVEQLAVPRIGLAVATDAGLVVPTLELTWFMSPAAIAGVRAQAVQHARSGRLQAGEAQEPSFIVSNLGPLGVDAFTALLDPAAAAVLAVGRVREGVWVQAGALKATWLCTLTLTVDHRVGDGADAAALLAALAEYLENVGAVPTEGEVGQ